MAEQIALERIEIEFDLHFREGLNQDAISRYADVWDSLPPIKCVRLEDGTLLLASGLHRYHGYEKAGETTIPTEITEGTRRDAMVIGLKDNALHGLPLSRDERNRAIAQLAKEGMSYPAIGEIFSLGDNMVGKIAKAHGIERRLKEVNQKGQRTREDAANNRNNYGADSDMDANNYAEKATSEPKGEQIDPVIDAESTTTVEPDNANTNISEDKIAPVPHAIGQATPEKEPESSLDSVEEASKTSEDEPVSVQLSVYQWEALVECAELALRGSQDEVAQSAVDSIKQQFSSMGIAWCTDD